MVMIGIDPHKGTHTAVAIDDREQVLTERLVRATLKRPGFHRGSLVWVPAPSVGLD